MKYVKCMLCNGHYTLQENNHKNFAGCSNHPRCRSALTIHNWVLGFIATYGIGIYQWEKECWKCGMKTPVYSYYLDYELSEISGYFSSAFGTVGLGDIPFLDKLLEKRYPTIMMKYSKSAKTSYIANTCKYCSSIQGRNYVVDDPHEILYSLYVMHDMHKYLFEVVTFKNIEPLRADIKRIYGE